MRHLNRMLLTAVAVATLGTSVAGADTLTPRAERRQARQHERVYRGWCAGRPTRPEMRRLRRAEMRIRRAARRLKAGGRVPRREHQRLHRALDRQDRMIRRFMHNGRCYLY